MFLSILFKDESEYLEKKQTPQDTTETHDTTAVQSTLTKVPVRPPGAVCLMPVPGAGNTKPDWMEELNRKNKERKEKAALEEKAAQEKEAEKGKEKNEDADDNPEANVCCRIF